MPASLKAQASRSPDTFDDEITDPGASLVLARSPFGYGHCPEGEVAPGNVVVTGAELLPPPVVAGSVVTETSRAAGRNNRAPSDQAGSRVGCRKWWSDMLDLLSSRDGHQLAARSTGRALDAPALHRCERAENGLGCRQRALRFQ